MQEVTIFPPKVSETPKTHSSKTNDLKPNFQSELKSQKEKPKMENSQKEKPKMENSTKVENKIPEKERKIENSQKEENKIPEKERKIENSQKEENEISKEEQIIEDFIKKENIIPEEEQIIENLAKEENNIPKEEQIIEDFIEKENNFPEEELIIANSLEEEQIIEDSPKGKQIIEDSLKGKQIIEDSPQEDKDIYLNPDQKNIPIIEKNTKIIDPKEEFVINEEEIEDTTNQETLDHPDEQINQRVDSPQEDKDIYLNQDQKNIPIIEKEITREEVLPRIDNKMMKEKILPQINEDSTPEGISEDSTPEGISEVVINQEELLNSFNQETLEHLDQQNNQKGDKNSTAPVIVQDNTLPKEKNSVQSLENLLNSGNNTENRKNMPSLSESKKEPSLNIQRENSPKNTLNQDHKFEANKMIPSNEIIVIDTKNSSLAEEGANITRVKGENILPNSKIIVPSLVGEKIIEPKMLKSELKLELKPELKSEANENILLDPKQDGFENSPHDSPDEERSEGNNKAHRQISTQNKTSSDLLETNNNVINSTEKKEIPALNNLSKADTVKLEKTLTKDLIENIKTTITSQKREMVISLTPKDLGRVKIEIVSIAASDGVQKIQQVKILAEKRSALEIIERHSEELVKSLKEVSQIKEETELRFEMQQQNQKENNQAYFESPEERDAWMKQFSGLVKADDEKPKTESLNTPEEVGRYGLNMSVEV